MRGPRNSSVPIGLPVKLESVQLRYFGVPNNKLDAPAIASRLAQRLGTQVILPNVESLSLLDDLHLNFDTAERWSAAFLTELTPILQRCLPKENQGAF